MFDRVYLIDKPNILVVGNLMIDHYLCGQCEIISPEAPVQIVDIQNETTVLDGAENAINDLVVLGSSVSAADPQLICQPYIIHRI